MMEIRETIFVRKTYDTPLKKKSARRFLKKKNCVTNYLNKNYLTKIIMTENLRKQYLKKHPQIHILNHLPFRKNSQTRGMN